MATDANNRQDQRKNKSKNKTEARVLELTAVCSDKSKERGLLATLSDVQVQEESGELNLSSVAKTLSATDLADSTELFGSICRSIYAFFSWRTDRVAAHFVQSTGLIMWLAGEEYNTDLVGKYWLILYSSF